MSDPGCTGCPPPVGNPNLDCLHHEQLLACRIEVRHRQQHADAAMAAANQIADRLASEAAYAGLVAQVLAVVQRLEARLCGDEPDADTPAADTTPAEVSALEEAMFTVHWWGGWKHLTRRMSLRARDAAANAVDKVAAARGQTWQVDRWWRS